MSKELPEDLLTTILLKLPMKTIILCAAVCKTWYNLITNPIFITTHHNFHNNNNTPRLLLRYFKNSGQEIVDRFALYHDNETFDLLTNFEFPFKSSNGSFRVIGSCNGLICLSDDYACNMGKIILWNPSIKKALYLPEPIYVHSSEYFSPKTSLGFGFDFATNDYKLVRITHLDLNGMYPKLEIYRLRTRIWEDISRLAHPCYIVQRSIGVYVNGALHWIGWDWGHKYMIVSFDMQSEVFREMMLPSSLANDRAWKNNILDCKGLLCLVHNFDDWRCWLRFDIWLMKEYGVAESWIRCFSVNNSILCRPLGFKDNGDMLWAAETGRVVSYRPQNQQMKFLGIYGSYTSLILFYVGTCTESLALLNGNSCDANDKCNKERRERDEQGPDSGDRPKQLSKQKRRWIKGLAARCQNFFAFA